MGQQMAKDSMIEEMADNVMLISRVHETTSEHSQKLIKSKRSIEYSFSTEKNELDRHGIN